jgi:hypothetical protein
MTQSLSSFLLLMGHCPINFVNKCINWPPDLLDNQIENCLTLSLIWEGHTCICGLHALFLGVFLRPWTPPQ